MKRKTARLILNPRSTEGFGKVEAILAVLAAAGWKTSTAINEFGGHAVRLAKDAANDGCDLVIGYGGDGTLNQVVNGVMSAKRRRCVVGVIPGGTANVWAQELCMPDEPVRAALYLVNCQARKVDLGHVHVEPVSRVGRRHHFLLMAGLGMDAAILRHVSSSLRHKIGDAAIALAAVKELPSQRKFPIEIRTSRHRGRQAVTWRGEAHQVLIGNTRRYGNAVKATPSAYVDDGILDVCVITAGDALSTARQIASMLLRRRPLRGHSKYFRSARVEISVPSSIDLHLDGSRVKREDHGESTMVRYCFQSLPHAIQVAVPRTYDGALFRHRRRAKRAARPSSNGRPNDDAAHIVNGRKVTVVATGPNPARRNSYIVAGETPAKNSEATKPVAVSVDASIAAELHEGDALVVDGKKTKRGVIRAKRVAAVK